MKDKNNTQPLSNFPSSSVNAAGEQDERVTQDAPADRELKSLLNHWSAPATPQSLDGRLLHVYRQEFKRAPFWKRLLGARASAPHQSVPSRKEVLMKKCSTCHDEFADKFSFCPVDGTPLNELAAAIVASPPLDEVQMHAEERSSVSAIPTYTNPGYHLTIIEDAGIAHRLMGELRNVKERSQLTWPEFKRDPAGFSKRLAAGYGNSAWRFFSTPTVAVGTVSAVLLVTTAVLLLVGLDRWRVRTAELAEKQRDDLVLEQLINTSKDIPDVEPEKKDDGIGTGKKGRVGFKEGKGEGSEPEFKRAGGGGGGGRQESLPAQVGKIPPPSDIRAAIPKLPPMTPPALPVGGSDLDPALYKNLPYDRYGDPRSKSTDPSNGPGTGGGMGTGDGSGTGEGRNGGVGPGEGGNMGGGPKRLGGGGDGGGDGDGGPPVDYSKIFNAREVTQKARILSKPEPQYTEDARKNQVSGTVVLRAVFSSGGQVTNIRAVNGLPFGLTEKAIAAARMIRFSPAMKDGRAVSQHIQIEYNFNLY